VADIDTKQLRAHSMTETPEERAAILQRMRAASNQFYYAATTAGCHAFIEFTGLMNEYIKLCEEADAAGIEWVHASVHGDVHLPFQPHHIGYLNEKLECIYGRRLADGTDECTGIHAAIGVVEARQQYYEAYRCLCPANQTADGIDHTVPHLLDCKGATMATRPATFATIVDILSHLDALLAQTRAR